MGRERGATRAAVDPQGFVWCRERLHNQPLPPATVVLISSPPRGGPFFATASTYSVDHLFSPGVETCALLSSGKTTLRNGGSR